MSKARNRFYEALILLHALDPIQGERISGDAYESEDTMARDSVLQRRRVLNLLCQMCDHTKGGETVTAIAVEKTPAGPVYWLSSPKDVTNKILPFLEKVLGILGEGSYSSPNQLECRLFDMFLKFNASRLRDTASLLHREIRKLNEWGLHTETDAEFAEVTNTWLKPFFEYLSLQALCQHAYRASKSLPLREKCSDWDQKALDRGSTCLVWHYIGRISSLVRAAKFLSLTALPQIMMFEDFRTQPVLCGGPGPKPIYKKSLPLNQVASKMLPKDSPDLLEVQASLDDLDRKFGLKKRMLELYESSSFRPKVHAELAVLEAMYDAGVDFYDDDRFIGCSKGACFCCYHYICYHPGRFVRPSSHNKIWPNWCPPMRADIHQSKVMQKLIDEIRDKALEGVRKQSGRHRFHPDSTSGVSRTIGSRAASVPRRIEPLEEAPNDPSGEASVHATASDEDSSDGGVRLFTEHLRIA